MSERVDLTWAVVTRGLTVGEELEVGGAVYRRLPDAPDRWSSAVPLETMIEELTADGETLCIGTDEEGWVAWLRDHLYIGGGPTPTAAIAALHTACQERGNDAD